MQKRGHVLVAHLQAVTQSPPTHEWQISAVQAFACILQDALRSDHKQAQNHETERLAIYFCIRFCTLLQLPALAQNLL